MEKAFDKQIKTTEDQGEKQIKAIQDQGRAKTIKKYDYDDKDNPLILKQKEIFNELVDEKLDEITELDETVNCDDLIHRCKGKNSNEKFNKYDSALHLINKMRNGEIKLSDVKNDQTTFKSNLGEIKKINNKKRSKEQRNVLYNIEMLYKARNEAFKFYDLQ